MVRYDMDVLIASVDLGVRLLTPIEGSQQPRTDQAGDAAVIHRRHRRRHGPLPGLGVRIRFGRFRVDTRGRSWVFGAGSQLPA